MSKLVLSLLAVVALSAPAQAGALSKSVSVAKSGVNTLVVSPLKKIVGVAKGLVQGAVGLVADSAKSLVK